MVRGRRFPRERGSAWRSGAGVMHADSPVSRRHAAVALRLADDDTRGPGPRPAFSARCSRLEPIGARRASRKDCAGALRPVVGHIRRFRVPSQRWIVDRWIGSLLTVARVRRDPSPPIHEAAGRVELPRPTVGLGIGAIGRSLPAVTGFTAPTSCRPHSMRTRTCSAFRFPAAQQAPCVARPIVDEQEFRA